jgi:uncharacterized RDD family membrane protein YckC
LVARLIDTGILIGVLVVLGGCSNAMQNSAEPLAVLVSLVALAILYGYEFYMIGRYGQTVGKRVMKLRVVKLSGEPAGWGASAARSIVPMLISCFTCGLGGMLFYLSPLFDNSPWKRGWHDQIASTVVVGTATASAPTAGR